MDSVSLLKRVDTKFILRQSSLPEILSPLLSEYSILEIKEKRILTYKSLYFDTHSKKFYNDHHNGKIKRTKVRMRQYVDSDLFFFEIKKKDGRGNTNKKRIQIPGFRDLSTSPYQIFLNEVTEAQFDLQPVLWNSFSRITLVSKKARERITIDTNISFTFEGKDHHLSNLAIIEVKQARYNPNSWIVRSLKKNNIHSTGFSKYCIGMLSLDDTLKYNAFKPKLLKMKKIRN